MKQDRNTDNRRRSEPEEIAARWRGDKGAKRQSGTGEGDKEEKQRASAVVDPSEGGGGGTRQL